MALAAALLIPTCVVLGRWRAAPSRAYRPGPLPAEYLDKGMACLAAGQVRPPLMELSDEELETCARIIGRLLHAYERGAFELTLFNRGILLIFSDDERVRRMHRALCVVHDAVERLGGSEAG